MVFDLALSLVSGGESRTLSHRLAVGRKLTVPSNPAEHSSLPTPGLTPYLNTGMNGIHI